MFEEHKEMEGKILRTKLLQGDDFHDPLGEKKRL